ncbi:uncharacterized protein LOC106643360 [Copidosoma floridanum]|uniref:uncharacterized protein LOC106643360 n=1 Tax=Copidosoma floridanum TaxID=29053 RepID=UPI0006C9457F|nr:uncharacterized protein LOC106643360 [Copidosoma floridanum]
MLNGLIKGPRGTPLAQNTIFGWILTGESSGPLSVSKETVRVLNVSVEHSLSSLLSKFWEIEEIDAPKPLSPENLYWHMEPVPKHDSNKSSYYMPHHAVFRQGNPDKIRVVFNASQRASSGQSLNDFLLPGPKLQSDITVVIMHHDDIDWQRIVWRPDRSQPIQDYRATTVTYGTASAPYLALRVLQQLAHDEGGAYPEAAIILRHQMYVDDAFGGADDVGSALRCRDQLITVLKSVGMLLSKWAANDAALLGGLDSLADSEIAFKVEESVSALGLLWQPRDDVFDLRIEWASAGSELTKRGILSDISRLFDPMGWLAPVLITAKIVLQDVWLSGVDWDDRVPGELCKKWSGFRSLLRDLTKIKIQRWIGGAETDGWTLHGFADASKRAYAAAIYAVLPGCSSTLLIAKTKIAPVKVQSLPRLELCGAHLLARLIGGTLARLRRPPDEIHLWTDSRVVLDWLASHPSRWQTFVANRVSEIVSSLPQAQWHHVRSAQNPADCATRGVTPAQLSTHDLRWRGPAWLVLSSSEWPMLDVGDRAESLLVEQREAEVAVCVAHSDEGLNVVTKLEKYSSFSRILRILSGDALDHLALTPGHFLVGSALLSYPEPYDKSHCSTSLNHRWKQIVNIRNSFWSRWRKEVLNQLQQRNKWLKQAPNFEQGDVVLVKDELAPPA